MLDKRASVTVAVCVASAAYVLWRVWRSYGTPPIYGSIPFIGAAIPFGKAPLTYIKECRDKVD
jgi:hypothetical protein